MSSSVPSGDSTDSDGAEPQPGRGLSVRPLLFVAASALLYVGIYRVCANFDSLYRALGVDLPWVTRTVLATYQFSGALLLIGLVPCAVLLTKRKLSPET